MIKTVAEPDIFVYNLIRKKIDFNCLSTQKQIEYKEKRSTPPLELHYNDNGTVKSFNTKWYDDYKWLTGVKSLNKLFCFACVIFGGETAWTYHGIENIKRFTERAAKHQLSKSHITSMISFEMLGKVPRLREKEIAERSKQEANRVLTAEILSKLIDMIIVLNRHGKGGDIFSRNEKNSLGEMILKRNLFDTTIYEQLYNDVNKKLVETMENQLLTDIKKEISETEFCSILIDKIPTKGTEYAVIARYTHEGQIKERFVGLYNIVQIFDLAQIFNNVTRDIRKAVCHSYDGSHVMTPLRLNIKTIMPKLLLLPNRLHRLNTLILQNLECVRECKYFIWQVTSIHDFFRMPKINRFLKKHGVNLPLECETLWPFHSKTIPSILLNQQRLLKIVNSIILQPFIMDVQTMNAAYFVQKTLYCSLFMMFCSLFTKIFAYTDHLTSTIQKKLNEDIHLCIQEVEQTIKNISNLKAIVCIKQCMDENRIRLKKDNAYVEKVKTIKSTSSVIIYHIVTQMKEIFDDIRYLKFAELLDETKFSLYKSKFPKQVLTELMDVHLNFFDSIKLENELMLIYSDPMKRLNPSQLFYYLYDNGLDAVFSETYRLLKLYLTYPLVPTQKGTRCTLNKLKTFFNIEEEEKFPMLYVESYPEDSTQYDDFKKRVIQTMNEFTPVYVID